MVAVAHRRLVGGQDRRQRFLAALERHLAQVPAVEVQQVEGEVDQGLGAPSDSAS